MKLAEINIQSMYSLYSNMHNITNSYIYPEQYLCKNCFQDFSVNWTFRANLYNPYVCRGNTIICPYCGKTHMSKDKLIGQKNEYMPTDLVIGLYVFKNIIKLRIKYNAFCFVDLYKKNWREGVEIFKFDTKRKETTFTSTYSDDNYDSSEFVECKFSIDNSYAIYENSILKYLKKPSLANRNKDIVNILKMTKEEITKRISNKEKIKSLYYRYGEDKSNFLLSLINFMYRIKYPHNENIKHQELFKKYDSHKLYYFPSTFLKKEEIVEIHEKIKNKCDFITAIIEVLNLPNKPIIRKEINKNYKNCAYFIILNDVFKNYDLMIKAYYEILNLSKHYKAQIKYLYEVKKYFKYLTENQVLNFISYWNKYSVVDSVKMFEKLNEEEKAEFYTKKIKPKHIHDWLVYKNKLRNHKNRKITNSEKIIKKLTMTVGEFDFKLPSETRDLIEAGHKLKNCVGTYGDRLINENCKIVLVENKEKKLTACVEIGNKKIVQAKIFDNEPVYKNKELNKAMILWSKKSRLAIETKDIVNC